MSHKMQEQLTLRKHLGQSPVILVFCCQFFFFTLSLDCLFLICPIGFPNVYS